MRCSECPGQNRCVEADGPSTKGNVMFLGEAPGKDETAKGYPFVGKTGQEFTQHYLGLAGLRRPCVYVTNAIRCQPITSGGKLDPKRVKDLDMLYACAEQFLYKDIKRLQPRLIVPMGSFACKALSPDINLELQHGYPVQTSFGTVFPMYHPAIGIHEPKRMLQLRLDWIRLGRYLKGKLSIPVDEYPDVDYREVDAKGVDEDLADAYDQPLACDTENTKKGDPYCLTYSVVKGTGRLIRADNLRALRRFQYHVDRWRTRQILWHNWLHDEKITLVMGLQFEERLIRDTMVRVFHLGILPQGLKALAYRELGMEMTDFDDVVTPHSSKLVLDYYWKMVGVDWPKPEPQQVRQDDGSFKPYKPQGLNTKLKRFFTDYAKNPDKDIFEMWDNWGGSHSMITEKIGEWPGKCISHAPFNEVLFYACRDSDALLRLWPILKHMSARVRKAKPEDWRKVA